MNQELDLLALSLCPSLDWDRDKHNWVEGFKAGVGHLQGFTTNQLKEYNMQDTFQWSDELALEFAKEYRFSSSRVSVEQFKSSKSPKKEWEIVAFRVADTEAKFTEMPMNKGVYWDKGCNQKPVDELLSEKNYEIFSVRRLSDGAVFTKNEVVGTPSDGHHHIGGFEVRGNFLYAQFSVGQISIEHLQKLPQPILTTVDQKEVKEGDLVFYVNSDNFISDIWVTKDSFGDDKNPCNVFSTREAAEEYILNNRLVLSLSDVKEAWNDFGWLKHEEALEKLTALVKQKLNQ